MSFLSGLESHWLFEPFQEVALGTVGLWWAVPFVALLVFGMVLKHGFGIEYSPDVFPDGMGPAGKVLTAVIAAPILEEGIFRIIPSLIGFTFEGMLIATVIWVLLHGKRFPVVALFAPIYLKLALGGFLLELVLVHGFHNAIATTAHLYREQNSEDADENEDSDMPDDFSFTDPETWPDEWSE